jgi:glycosyltransferase involved in cell wall biosynthesis
MKNGIITTMRTRLIFNCAYFIGKRIYYGFYFKNLIERRRNRLFLKQARDNLSTSSIHEEPLVSVLIPTYNRAKILVERAIPSVLNQTYQNFEIIIVGDGCASEQMEILNTLKDKRIKFYNLPNRGNYPKKPHDRWMVAGTIPRNKAIELCSGEWIAPLDDDDEFLDDHIETLLNFAIKNDFEMVFGKVKMQLKQDKWIELGSYPLKSGQISHISVLYHSKIKFLKYDVDAWKYGEAADWNMWRRMKEAGVKIGFVNKVVGKHFLEGSQRGV